MNIGETGGPYAAITGCGHYTPERVLTNADLERMVETSDEWIVARTGMRERRVVGPDESSSTMATRAAQRALAVAGCTPETLDLIIVATVTPDYLFPSTACQVQTQLGVTRIPAFDINAACSGFVYALGTATQFIRTGVYKRILVIGVETLTRFTDYTDRSTCILFGDGAGAVIIEATEQPRGLLSLTMGADGSGGDLLILPGIGSKHPITHETLERGDQYIKMAGSAVFKFAVRMMGDASIEAIARAGMQLRDIDMLVPHQANLRIIEATAKRLDMPMEKVWVNIDRYGNTSAATIPISLSEMHERGLLHEGQNLLLAAFGGGLTWAAAVVRWGTGCEGRGVTATAWVFPGQGSQTVGMGKALADSDPAARARFAEADDALGFALSNIIWNGPDTTLQQTDIQQPAILVVSTVHFDVLKRRGLLPNAAFAAGHSLGQYSAAVATGAIAFADAVRLVRRRGQLMQEYGHGAMAAILGMETEAVEALAHEAGVEVANINAPGQVTIAGRKEDVERAAELAKERDARRAIMLAVSAAFHTSLMRPVAESLTPLLKETTINDPSVPIMANVSGQPCVTAIAVRAELIGHIDSPVQWVRAVETMQGAGVTDYLEIGPGNVLGGLIKRIDKVAQTQTSDALLASM